MKRQLSAIHAWPGRFCQLFDDVKFDLRDPAFSYPQRIGRRM